MENRKITVLKIAADKLHAEVVMIPDELNIYQDFVEGCIEIVRLNKNCALVVNDEGLIRDMAFNPIATGLYASIGGVTPICGNAWLVGLDGEGGFCDVPPNDVLFTCRVSKKAIQFAEECKAILDDAKDANSMPC